MANWSILVDYLKLSASDAKTITDSVANHFVAVDKINIAATFKGTTTEESFKALSTLAKWVTYDGFSPITTLKELNERAKKFNATEKPNIDEVFSFEVGSIKYTLKKACDLVQDTQFLITVFLVRGNNIFKILKTLEKEAKTGLSTKCIAYGIKSDDDRVEKNRMRRDRVILSSTDITLSRVAKSLPHITLAIAMKHEIYGKANPAIIITQYKISKKSKNPVKMPAVLTHGLLPSMLKRGEPANQTAWHFCYAFNFEQTMTLMTPNVKRQAMNEPVGANVESSMKFVDAVINGPLNTDEDRTVLLKAFQTNTPDFDTWMTAGSAAWNYITTEYNYSGAYASITKAFNNEGKAV